METPNQPASSWQFTSSDEQQQIPTSAYDDDVNDVSISWTASEFVTYEKSKGWYALAFGVLLVSIALIFFATRDVVSVGTIFLLGAFFIIFSSRKPRVLNYQISSQGIVIDKKMYSFSLMRSYSIIEGSSMKYIDIMPMQRFMPSISIYYDPKDEPYIISTLSQFLPREDRKQPLIDALMHRIRF